MNEVSRYSNWVYCLGAQQNTDVLSKVQRLGLFTVIHAANHEGEKGVHVSLELFFSLLDIMDRLNIQLPYHNVIFTFYFWGKKK